MSVPIRPVVASIVGTVVLAGIACQWTGGGGADSRPLRGSVGNSHADSLPHARDTASLESAPGLVSAAAGPAWIQTGLDERLAHALAADLNIVLQALLEVDYASYEALMNRRRAVLAPSASAFAEHEFQYPEYADIRQAARNWPAAVQAAFLWSQPARRHAEIVRVDAAAATFGINCMELGDEWDAYVGMYSVFLPRGKEPLEMALQAADGEIPCAWAQMPVVLSGAGETLLRMNFYYHEDDRHWYPMFIMVRATGDRIRPMF